MKIIAISDLHGYLPDMTEYGKFDLLLIAGDICPAYDHSYQFQYEWLKNELVPWIQNLPYNNVWSKVIFTPGNHSTWFEREDPQSAKYLADIGYPCQGRFIYLRNNFYTFDYLNEHGELCYLNIFGTPWCHQFGNWSFMCSDDKLRKKFSEIPENIDILLTHDAPYGCSDQCYQGRSLGKHVGSIPLREVILEKKPKLCIHGHLHTSNHSMMALGKTRVVNVSLLDEAYQVAFDPYFLTDSFFKLDLEERFDEEYIFPNRDENLVKLVKREGSEYVLRTSNNESVQLTWSGETIYIVDPPGGPVLCAGAQWYDFKIEEINYIDGEFLFTLKKIKDGFPD